MKQRLQKILSDRGLTSRRKAEQMLRQGLVAVNGVTACLGDSADPDVDHITVEGRALPSAQPYIYIMLNKPRGCVTTLSDEKGRKNAAALVADCGVRVYPVGRLDMDSEGLLLFTNDGEFANRAMHPSHEIEKTYLVRADGFSPDAFQKLRKPIVLDGYRIKPPKLTLLSAQKTQCIFEITIHEGRNRQIRRMCEAAHMKVLRLKRIREGALSLGDLGPGKWRYLSSEEIRMLSGK